MTLHFFHAYIIFRFVYLPFALNSIRPCFCFVLQSRVQSSSNKYLDLNIRVRKIKSKTQSHFYINKAQLSSWSCWYYYRYGDRGGVIVLHYSVAKVIARHIYFDLSAYVFSSLSGLRRSCLSIHMVDAQTRHTLVVICNFCAL